MKNYVLLFLSLLIVCQVQAGIYTKNYWDKSELTVCFAEGESTSRSIRKEKFKATNWRPQEKEQIQNWVNSEYQKKSSGLSFNGWKDCKKTESPDVVIFRANLSGFLRLFDGQSGFAYWFGIEGDPTEGINIQGFTTARNAIVLNNHGLTKSVVVHEMGHIAGLVHEHTHPDAFNIEKERCSAVRQTVYRDDFFYTSYDSYSIMNYCYVLTGDNFGLSKKDKSLLKVMYPGHQ